MVFTINGFSQEVLLSMGLNSDDANVLRYIVDFWHTGKMKKYTIKGKEYFWINYRNLLEELPILELTSPIVLRRWFVKYETAKLMESAVIHGNVTCYRFTERYQELVSKPLRIQAKTDTPKLNSLGHETPEMHEPQAESPTPKLNSLGAKPKSLGPKLNSLGALNSKVEGVYKDDPSTSDPTTAASEITARIVAETTTVSKPRSVVQPRSAAAVVAEEQDRQRRGQTEAHLQRQLWLFETLKTQATADALTELACTYKIPAISLEQFVAQQLVRTLDDLKTALDATKKRQIRPQGFLAYASRMFFEGQCTVIPETEDAPARSSFSDEENAIARRQQAAQGW